jgi:pseudouridine kinase
MDLHWLKGKMDDINHSEIIVADTLLSAEALAHLIDHCEKPLYIDTVSPGKAMRLAEAMKMSEKQRIFTLKCNLPEALALTNEKDAEAAVKQLNANGIKHVYLTLGSDGIIHCSNGEARHYPALPTQITNVTGSGDAFFAGIIHANALGHFSDAAVSFGLKAAQHNIKSEAPVNPTLRLDVFNE